MEKGYPLIIVFYLDRETMKSKMMGAFAESVNHAIAKREANAMAFFIPTDGEERIECVNPVQVEEVEMDRVNKIVSDLTREFDVNPDINIGSEGKQESDESGK